MEDVEVLCSRCGSADTQVLPTSDPVKRGFCLRCDKPFQATPCPHCGSYRIEGSFGVSGMRYQTLPDTVDCFDCRQELPARDPGPEGSARP